MNKMFESFQIGKEQIKNRLVASAMFEYGARDGSITPPIAERYRELAEGGAGLIITGMHAVRKAGSAAPLMVSTEDDGYIENMKKIVQTSHENGAKLFVQLQHCGMKTFYADHYDRISVCDKTTDDGRAFHAATDEELKLIVNDFGKAALRCKAAGADGVEIHAAHGYLINTFLSPSTNHRTDSYGGTIKNRARLLFEVYRSIRNAVGDEFPIGVKFPFSDLNDHSITKEESMFVCKELEKMGIDMIEVSSGMVMDGSEQSFTPRFPNGENAPFLANASDLANVLSIPVVSVCGYRSAQYIEKALDENPIAAVSFGRPLVCEPDLPNKLRSNDTVSKCVSCNACFESYKDGIITCQVRKNQKQFCPL